MDNTVLSREGRVSSLGVSGQGESLDFRLEETPQEAVGPAKVGAPIPETHLGPGCLLGPSSLHPCPSASFLLLVK